MVARGKAVLRRTTTRLISANQLHLVILFHSTIRPGFAFGTWILLLCLVACGSEYGVRLSFLDSADRTSSSRIELSLIASCGDQIAGEPPVRPVQRIEFANGPTETAIGAVEPGSYGLYGRAIDSSCQVVAAGCTPVELESNGKATLSVELASTSRPRCPPSATCDDGQCIGVADDSGVGDVRVLDARDVPDAGDASVLDARSDALDAGAIDAGAIDAGDAGPLDAGEDAGPLDAGPSGPLVHISCENSAATRVADESGNGRHAACFLGCPAIVPGAVGNACSFDGEGQHLRIANDPAFDSSSGYTAAGWVRVRNIQQQSPFALPYGAGLRNSWQLFLSEPRTSFVSTDGENGTVLSIDPLPTDTWRHYALVFTGTEQRIFVDGVLATSMSEPASGVFDGLHDVYIGGDENAGILAWPLDGEVDEFRLYDRPLDAAEVLSLFAERD